MLLRQMTQMPTNRHRFLAHMGQVDNQTAQLNSVWYFPITPKHILSLSLPPQPSHLSLSTHPLAMPVSLRSLNIPLSRLRGTTMPRCLVALITTHYFPPTNKAYLTILSMASMILFLLILLLMITILIPYIHSLLTTLASLALGQCLIIVASQCLSGTMAPTYVSSSDETSCQGHSVPLLLVPDVAILLRHYCETFAIFPLCGEQFLSVGRLLSVEVANSGRLSLSHVGRVEHTRDERRLPTSSFYAS